ncbi:MAG TPA: glycosyltransferase family 39 protein [Candidatus Dormibacteraeota bacterium]|nr:glycosyltransferase family 39 protein [Candidatus Dormibacteraeota bacterium]
MIAEQTASARWPGTLLALVVVALGWALLQLWGLGNTPFHTRGEPREAVVVQDLVAHDHWILPRRNGVELPRKPPLFYWLAGAASRALGRVDEPAVRLPSALQSGAAALLVTGAAAATLGPVAGAAAGLTLLSSFEWLRAATAARVDMTLTFGLTLVFVGLLLFRRRERTLWLCVFYLGAAWATLAKGIPGLAIPAFQVVLLCALDRSLLPLRRLRPVRGLIFVVVVTGAWYAAAAAQAGRAFLTIVANENLVRIVGAKSASLGHVHGFAYLVGVLLAGLLPWTLLLPSTALALWRDRVTIDRRDPRLFAMLWSFAVFLPFAIASSKRGVYLLPLYPAVALLVGWWAQRFWQGMVAGTGIRGALAVLLWPLALLCAALAVAAAGERAGLPLLAWLPDLGRGRSGAHLTAIVAACRSANGLSAILLAGAAVAALAGALALRRPRPRLLLASLAVLTAALALIVRLVVMPAIGAVETRREFAAALRAAVSDPGAVHTVPNLDYGTLFYWGGAMPVFDPRVGGQQPAYLLMPEPTWLRAPAALREDYVRLVGVRPPSGSSDDLPVILARRVPAATPAD